MVSIISSREALDLDKNSVDSGNAAAGLASLGDDSHAWQRAKKFIIYFVVCFLLYTDIMY